LPFNRLPVLPIAGLRVDEIVKDGLFVEVSTLGRDLRKGSIDTLQNLLVELLTI